MCSFSGAAEAALVYARGIKATGETASLPHAFAYPMTEAATTEGLPQAFPFVQLPSVAPPSSSSSSSSAAIVPQPACASLTASVAQASVAAAQASVTQRTELQPAILEVEEVSTDVAGGAGGAAAGAAVAPEVCHAAAALGAAAQRSPARQALQLLP